MLYFTREQLNEDWKRSKLEVAITLIKLSILLNLLSLSAPWTNETALLLTSTIRVRLRLQADCVRQIIGMVETQKAQA